MPESQHPRRMRRSAAAAVVAASLTMALAGPTSADSSTSIGPSSATAPYVLTVADGVHIKSLLTVGDAGSASNGYEMVGIPDGLGIMQQGANLVLYMNQELRDTQGIVRRHGQAAARQTQRRQMGRRRESRTLPKRSRLSLRLALGFQAIRPFRQMAQRHCRTARLGRG